MTCSSLILFLLYYSFSNLYTANQQTHSLCSYTCSIYATISIHESFTLQLICFISINITVIVSIVVSDKCVFIYIGCHHFIQGC